MASGSTSSSPLFDQPYSDINWNGGPGMRRRENDSLVPPERRDSASQPLFSQGQSAYYAHQSRRRASSGSAADRWVPRLFKLVLWSPAIVVAIWSVSALVFTKSRNSVQVRPSQGAVPRSSNSKNAAHSRHSSEAWNEGLLNTLEVVETALGESQPKRNIPVIAPLGAAQGGHASRMAQFVDRMGNIVHRPVQGKSQIIVQPGTLMKPQSQGSEGVYQQPAMQAESVYQQPAMKAEGAYQQPAMQAEGVYQQPAMQAEGVYQQPAMQGGGVYQQPAMQAEGVYQQPAMQAGGVYQQPAMQAGGVYQQPAMQAGGIQQQPAQQAMQPLGATGHLRGASKTQYLYYNPRDVMVVDGQVVLPHTAYDANGKPHDLSRSHAQVYFQPPPLYGVHHFNSSNATASNYTFTHPNTVKTPVMDNRPKEGYALPAVAPMVEGGSSILVATVGVVALLVGALSARHARGRACLSSCLENEHLVANEAAYDLAHTTNSNTTSYSTFWKGDLEKFDV
jgi:hypothetical protein